MTAASLTGERRLAYVGKLSVEKGVPCLLAAMPDMLARSPDLRLLLIGSGVAEASLLRLVRSLEAGDLEDAVQALDEACGDPLEEEWSLPVRRHWAQCDREAYLARARDFRVSSRVSFLGQMSSEDIAALLPTVEVLAVPSVVREAFPLVSLEALACGVVPVGSYKGGLAAILDQVAAAVGPLGAFVRLDPDPDAFVRDIADKVPALLERLAAPGARAEAARRCRALAEDRYDWERVVDQLQRLYEDAASGRFGAGA